MGSYHITRLVAALVSLAMTSVSLPASACDLLCCFHRLHAAVRAVNFAASAERSKDSKTISSSPSRGNTRSHHCEGMAIKRGERTSVKSGLASTPDRVATLGDCGRDECRKSVALALVVRTIQFSPLQLARVLQGDVRSPLRVAHEIHAARILFGLALPALPLRI
jgi:hypothetical protein